MKLYPDEDSVDGQLAALLRKAGHDVQLSAEAGLDGQPDPRQFTQAIRQGRVLLSGNHHDSLLLHDLAVTAGHHPGILIVRKDNDPRRDLSARGVCVAIAKLEASGVPIADNLHVLNHWR